MATHDSGGRKLSVPVTIDLLEAGADETTPKLTAYAFSTGGKLLSRHDLDAKGGATLPIPGGKEPTGARVVVGPRLEDKDFETSSALLAELIRRGAVEQHLRIEPKIAIEKIHFPLIPEIWRCWLLGLCIVRGKLLKRVERDGIALDLPVCHATVEIYEVDAFPLIIDRIPRWVLERVRREVLDLDLSMAQIDRPLIDAARLRDPVRTPITKADVAPMRMSMKAAAKVVGHAGHTDPAPVAHTGHEEAHAMGVAMDENAAAAVSSTLRASIDSTVRLRIKMASDMELKRLIVDYIHIFRPWFCFFYPWLWIRRKVATAHTDECGHFSAWVFRGCDNPDKPDYYFKATQKFLGWIPITIYEPLPVPCYTFWDYKCGTEVTLYTTHPLARTCSPCKPVVAGDNWVLVTGFGPTSLASVRGASAALAATTDASNLGMTGDGAPFGGMLRLRIEFDNALREDLHVKYYRVSYRQGTSGPFSVLDGAVVRHYTHVVAGEPVASMYPLGPNVIGGEPALFEIPPGVPPLGQWSTPDPIEDWTSAKFPSAGLQTTLPAGSKSGLYQLKVDLFTETGALVNIDAAATKIGYFVPDVTDLTGTVTTDPATSLGLVLDDDADGKKSFLLNVYVDNDECTAAIAAPDLDGVAADAHCGVIEYAGNTPAGTVHMPFQASHPHGFATYSFAVRRSSTVIYSQGGPVGAGMFNASQPVGAMLDGCSAAAFAENVYVAATATDGWSRLSGYDDSDIRAFAIAPESPGH